MINVYHSRGILVHTINIDNEFECIKESILPVHFNVVAIEEHVGGVEHSIQTVKEVPICDIQRLPHINYPRAMIKRCVIKRVKNLNQLPLNNGISTKLNPTTLLTGKPSPVTKLKFGDYVQAYNPSKIKNTPTSRTVGAVVLY